MTHMCKMKKKYEVWRHLHVLSDIHTDQITLKKMSQSKSKHGLKHESHEN